MQSHVRYFLICSAALWLLTLAGSFVPGPFTWGFHSLAFLPSAVRVAYALAGLFLLLLLSRTAVRERAEALLGRASSNPVPMLAGTIIAFLAAAVALRITVPLLGDSFIAIKLYENRAGGPPFLPNSHYPLAFFYFFSVMRWLGTFTFPRIMDAFLVGEMALGAGTIAAFWYTTRTLFDEPRMQVASFLLLTVLPAAQIFFGYVEIYAMSLFFLSLYLLCAALFIKKRLPFYVLSMVYLGLVLSHYLNGLLFPSFLYLTYRAFRTEGVRSVAAGIGAAASLGVALWLLSGVGLASLVPAPRHSPILSVGQAEDIFQAYSLFSPFHFIDLANFLLLTCPAGIALLIFAPSVRTIRTNTTATFLVFALVPVVIFFALTKFDLPMAQDWDIPAPYTVILTLLGLMLAAEKFGGRGAGAVIPLLVVTALSSFLYFGLNASIAPALARASTFVDKRVSSQDGSYQSTLHFVEYYRTTSDTARIDSAFERFLAMYPNDSRGYANYTLHLMEYGEREDAKIRDLFEQWQRVDPSNREARERYGDFLLDIGHREYKDGAVIDAAHHFEEAIQKNPSLAEAYNGLGVIYHRNGDLERATQYYEKAATLDSVNAYAFINLGNLYDDRGMPDRAIAYYRKAIGLEPNAAEAYFNLGVAYGRTGAAGPSLEAIRQAARLGLGDAQEYLRKKGESW